MNAFLDNAVVLETFQQLATPTNHALFPEISHHFICMAKDLQHVVYCDVYDEMPPVLHDRNTIITRLPDLRLPVAA